MFIDSDLELKGVETVYLYGSRVIRCRKMFIDSDLELKGVVSC